MRRWRRAALTGRRRRARPPPQCLLPLRLSRLRDTSMKSSPWSAWSSTSLSTCGAAPPTPASWIPGPQPQDKAPRPSSARLLRGSGASTPTSLLTPRVVRYATFKDLIEEQFAEHGIGADPGSVFLKESDCEFKMFASGRRFCQGALITLNVRTARTHACARRTPRPSSQPLPQMRRRQDLASWFLSLLYPEEDLLVRCPSPPPRLALRRVLTRAPALPRPSTCPWPVTRWTPSWWPCAAAASARPCTRRCAT